MIYSTGDIIENLNGLVWIADWNPDEILGIEYKDMKGVIGHYGSNVDDMVSYYINTNTNKVICAMRTDEENNEYHAEWGNEKE